MAPNRSTCSTETCHCPTSLQHERVTVLDRHFLEIETKVVDKPETFDGLPPMDRLLPRARSLAPGRPMFLSKGHPTKQDAR